MVSTIDYVGWTRVNVSLSINKIGSTIDKIASTISKMPFDCAQGDKTIDNMAPTIGNIGSTIDEVALIEDNLDSSIRRIGVYSVDFFR